MKQLYLSLFLLLKLKLNLLYQYILELQKMQQFLKLQWQKYLQVFKVPEHHI